jgi:hypothetical protein
MSSLLQMPHPPPAPALPAQLWQRVTVSQVERPAQAAAMPAFAPAPLALRIAPLPQFSAVNSSADQPAKRQRLDAQKQTLALHGAAAACHTAAANASVALPALRTVQLPPSRAEFRNRDTSVTRRVQCCIVDWNLIMTT